MASEPVASLSASARSFVKDLSVIFSQTMDENKSQSVDEFVARHPPQPNRVTGEREVKYLNLIQMTSREFNDEQDRKCTEAGIDRRELWRAKPRPHNPLATRRHFESKLSREELNILFNHGVVITNNTYSFGRAYQNIYSSDMPVYVSADSMLHAWHHSFDKMLSELETHVLSPALADMLGKLIDATANLEGINPGTVEDVIHFLAVPFALLRGVQSGAQLASTFAQDNVVPLFDRISRTLQLVAGLSPSAIPVFGEKPRTLDFSQFQPRGHYTSSKALEQYFKAMMWLGRTEFELTQKTPDDIVAAFVLQHLCQTTETQGVLNQMSALITNFIGVPDSMTFQELSTVMDQSGVSCVTYDHERDGERFIALLEEMDLGGQQINSQIRFVNEDVPRAATFFGQRFIIDSWAMCQTLFPKTERRIPSGVDVAYSVFGNDVAGSILGERMTNQNEDRVPFRDGVDIVAYLESVRQVIDNAPESFWSASIYGMWIRALRQLSVPSPSRGATFEGQGWKRKTMHSQLGSWAQLRHDTILYAKQGYTMMPCCEFPDALIDPHPLFWKAMAEMSDQSRQLIEEIGYPSGGLQPQHTEHLNRFSEAMRHLQALCEKQCEGVPFNQDDMLWLNNIVVTDHERFGSGSKTIWGGWYPDLYYGDKEAVSEGPALVADVHTDTPGNDDPGCIVHEGVGDVRLCYVIGVNDEGIETVYIGPVMMYHEMMCPFPKRLDDNAWKQMLREGAVNSPQWMQNLMLRTPEKGHLSRYR